MTGWGPLCSLFHAPLPGLLPCVLPVSHLRAEEPYFLAVSLSISAATAPSSVPGLLVWVSSSVSPRYSSLRAGYSRGASRGRGKWVLLSRTHRHWGAWWLQDWVLVSPGKPSDLYLGRGRRRAWRWGEGSRTRLAPAGPHLCIRRALGFPFCRVAGHQSTHFRVCLFLALPSVLFGSQNVCSEFLETAGAGVFSPATSPGSSL